MTINDEAKGERKNFEYCGHVAGFYKVLKKQGRRNRKIAKHFE